MGLRQCDKCSEMVDEAKAFCPSCGHAFVEEEKRKEPSAFESMEGTMQFGQTMYNQMLTDMGLNIAGAPNKPTETVKPAVQPAAQPRAQQIIQPAVQQVIRPATDVANQAKSGKTKWLIIGGIAFILLLLALIIVIVAAVVIWSQYR